METLIGHDGGQQPGELLVVLPQLGVRAQLALLLGLVQLRLDAVGCLLRDARHGPAPVLERGQGLRVLAAHGLAALVYLLGDAVEVGAVALGGLHVLVLAHVVGRALVVGHQPAHVRLQGVEVGLDHGGGVRHGQL